MLIRLAFAYLETKAALEGLTPTESAEHTRLALYLEAARIALDGVSSNV